ncbi:alpha/beta hydrolase [Herbiconiux sp. YIM B11900]|uniref:alpha/beta hydrolase n=1 Tax=Herbiconiux sp. YIM B11900 TaxID=3404131 RepID=UPI003F860BC9
MTDAASSPVRRRHPVARRIGAAALALLVLLVLAVVGFLADAHITYAAERDPVLALAENPAVDVQYSYGSVVLSPTGEANGVGLVFLAGAKVDPLAYAEKLSGAVEAGSTVVIVRPLANYAILEWRPIGDFTALAPGVETWYVGGHSLGGVKACQYAGDDAIAGLVLFGSYCAGDASGLGKPVLSISASNDGLSTPAKIEASRTQLPADTDFVVIEGANHAQFGDYGPQPGDGVSTTPDPQVRADITAALDPFLAKH